MLIILYGCGGSEGNYKEKNNSSIVAKVFEEIIAEEDTTDVAISNSTSNARPRVTKKFKPKVTYEDQSIIIKRACKGHFSDPDGDRIKCYVTGFDQLESAFVSSNILVINAPLNWTGTEDVFGAGRRVFGRYCECK